MHAGLLAAGSAYLYRSQSCSLMIWQCTEKGSDRHPTPPLWGMHAACFHHILHVRYLCRQQANFFFEVSLLKLLLNFVEMKGDENRGKRGFPRVESLP